MPCIEIILVISIGNITITHWGRLGIQEIDATYWAIRKLNGNLKVGVFFSKFKVNVAYGVDLGIDEHFQGDFTNVCSQLLPVKC